MKKGKRIVKPLFLKKKEISLIINMLTSLSISRSKEISTLIRKLNRIYEKKKRVPIHRKSEAKQTSFLGII